MGKVQKNNPGRRVLLVEPNYNNKYPPLGLMKLATYHRMRGDFVRFFKGDLRHLLSEQYAEFLVDKLQTIDSNVEWNRYVTKISHAILNGKKGQLEEVAKLSECYDAVILNWLLYFQKKYRSKRIIPELSWDRICIATLFTFYFKKTVETVNFCKDRLLAENGELLIGGILATVIPDELTSATGVKPIIGLLNKPGMLDRGDQVIIDELTPDYSILEEIDYIYPENNGYYGYTSRGCIRKCSFCAVPKLEPIFKHSISISKHLREVDERYGARKNLLLLDNNVLASKKFPQIIKEIRDIGFVPGATFAPPNMLKMAVENLKKGFNEFAYRRLANKLLHNFGIKLAGKTRSTYEIEMSKAGIDGTYLPTSKQIIEFYSSIEDLYESRRVKTKVKRYVDFNQGVDARLLDEEKMFLLSTIPIFPLRIAFDSMKFAAEYSNAIKLAAKYKIRNLSNYLLYNYEDKPIELYERMKLNVELSNEIDILIYSFPMRYSPIYDSNQLHHGRDYIGTHWSKKFIRSIQVVLNATKGKVGTHLEFFRAAFGKNEEEFNEILWMPESYILHRYYFRDIGLTNAWRVLFKSLSEEEFSSIAPTIESSVFKNTDSLNLSPKLRVLLKHYSNHFCPAPSDNENIEALKRLSFNQVEMGK
jgi:hypothetical protein